MITFKECQTPGYKARTMIFDKLDEAIGIAEQEQKACLTLNEPPITIAGKIKKLDTIRLALIDLVDDLKFEQGIKLNKKYKHF